MDEEGNKITSALGFRSTLEQSLLRVQLHFFFQCAFVTASCDPQCCAERSCSWRFSCTRDRLAVLNGYSGVFPGAEIVFLLHCRIASAAGLADMCQ
jgi:hypothetical protein